MKRDGITKELRAMITSGNYAPGCRIPIREELLELFGVSKGTVQAAINTLVEEGFLEACGSKGMIVSERPPHLFRVGMTIPGGDSGTLDKLWPLFNAAMRKHRKAGSPFTFETYQGVGLNIEDDVYAKLLDDVECRRIAGLVVTEELPLSRFQQLRKTELPAVLFSSEPQFTGRNLMKVSYDWTRLLEMAIARLKECGRKRLAILLNSEFKRKQIDAISQIAGSSGLDFRKEWFHAVALTYQMIPWTGNLIRAVFCGSGDERPDALLIMNDNLAPFALEGLNSLGLRIGTDIEVVAHCNFPSSSPAPAGVQRIGFDAQASLATAVSLLAKCNATGAAPELSLIEPIWEDGCENKTSR